MATKTKARGTQSRRNGRAGSTSVREALDTIAGSRIPEPPIGGLETRPAIVGDQRFEMMISDCGSNDRCPPNPLSGYLVQPGDGVNVANMWRPVLDDAVRLSITTTIERGMSVGFWGHEEELMQIALYLGERIAGLQVAFDPNSNVGWFKKA